MCVSIKLWIWNLKNQTNWSEDPHSPLVLEVKTQGLVSVEQGLQLFYPAALFNRK